MRLAEYYCGDPRLVLVPIEHLGPTGMSREIANLLTERAGWTAARIDLFDAAFALYWERGTALAARTRTWPAPRIRHVAVVTDPVRVRPYVQLLNTSAWMLYDVDLDPSVSHRELVAYLLAHGDRMAVSGEVTTAAVQSAAWWIERSAEERAAFATAAVHSTRPDAAALRALAEALPWLATLHHDTLRPALVTPVRPIPGTGLLVPKVVEAEPPRLVEAWRDAATAALRAYRASWTASPAASIAALVDWLATDAPPLLVTGHRGRIIWDPAAPERSGALRAELKQGDAVAVASIHDDLRLIAAKSRAILAALVDPAALPATDAAAEQTGYAYMHRERGLIAYNVREPGIERLSGPALPWASAMLGARTAHEWAHRVVDAGWVPPIVDADEIAARTAAFASAFDDVILASPPPVRAATARDLVTLAGKGSPGAALAAIVRSRMADYQSNLFARPFLDEREQETYVRHNVRALRAAYAPGDRWRMLARYLYEYQYLGFSQVEDPRTYLFRSTWFEDDFVATGVLDAARFDVLAGFVRRLCECFAVDPRRVRVTSATG